MAPVGEPERNASLRTYPPEASRDAGSIHKGSVFTGHERLPAFRRAARIVLSPTA